MNIVLLSGGSGKRLWPLSNDVRSKQFLRLFKNESGNYESMLQRVYRQICSVDSEADITIATSKSQVDSIKNQLGNKVSICVEPCRRDTFPAVVLAAAYLYYELKKRKDDCVIVCPVDPFVDYSYYKAIKKLENIVNNEKANITLMGIMPTCPSEKYGYIIPKNNEFVSPVKEFKEKPNRKEAEKYLKKGALWNAGIFAFKLNYLLDRAHEQISFNNYYDLLEKYSELEKISFDYAIVEKEPNVQVMRYSGEWKDIGTWSSLADVMADRTKGNVIVGNSCSDTNVINELDIPLLCMGCQNMIIVASEDGILVSSRKESEYIKPFVEKLSTSVRFAEKSWGSYKVIDIQKKSLTVKIYLNKGKSIQYHSHNNRDEILTVIKGRGKIIIDEKEIEVGTGSVIKVVAGEKHTILAQTDMEIIEVQVGEKIDKDDKIVYSINGLRECL